jgi:hypothetical protein
MKAPSPQVVVTMALIALFAAAFFSNPSDEQFRGALIGAFAAAYGYWLGSSSGSKQNGDVVRRIAEQPTVTATGDKPTIIAAEARPADDERSLEDPA